MRIIVKIVTHCTENIVETNFIVTILQSEMVSNKYIAVENEGRQNINELLTLKQLCSESAHARKTSKHVDWQKLHTSNWFIRQYAHQLRWKNIPLNLYSNKRLVTWHSRLKFVSWKFYFSFLSKGILLLCWRQGWVRYFTFALSRSKLEEALLRGSRFLHKSERISQCEFLGL